MERRLDTGIWKSALGLKREDPLIGRAGLGRGCRRDHEKWRTVSEEEVQDVSLALNLI